MLENDDNAEKNGPNITMMVKIHISSDKCHTVMSHHLSNISLLVQLN